MLKWRKTVESILKIVGVLLKVKYQLEALAREQGGEQLEGLVSQCEFAIARLEEADYNCRKHMLTAGQFKAKAEAYQQMAELLASHLSTLASPVYQNACRCDCDSDDATAQITKEDAHDE